MSCFFLITLWWNKFIVQQKSWRHLRAVFSCRKILCFLLIAKQCMLANREVSSR